MRTPPRPCAATQWAAAVAVVVAAAAGLAAAAEATDTAAASMALAVAMAVSVAAAVRPAVPRAVVARPQGSTAAWTWPYACFPRGDHRSQRQGL